MPEQNRNGVVVPDDSKWMHENDRAFWVIEAGPLCRHAKKGDIVLCDFNHQGVEPIVGDVEKRGFISEDHVIGFLVD